jgi:hypothetical protein
VVLVKPDIKKPDISVSKIEGFEYVCIAEYKTGKGFLKSS